jgi:hypothetical protein
MAPSPDALPTVAGVELCFATPRKPPKAARLTGRVAVLDIAFASESGGSSFERTTLPFIDALGERLVVWVDHHDSSFHRRYRDDPRFVLATKSEHGACPEMITPELVARHGAVDTIVCHVDFDGLASAAKWLRGGREPYPGCDDDARAVDTRVGEAGPHGQRFDRALRAQPRNARLQLAIVEQLYRGIDESSDWQLVDDAARELAPLEEEARRLAAGYRRLGREVALVEVDGAAARYDKTLLLLLGQREARIAVVVDGDTATFAAAYDSGVDFLMLFGLSGGMPTLVSLKRSRLDEALRLLGVDPQPSMRTS